ncbi:MAG: hypothetical protein M3O34_06960 [Chloroflexota bacterium]|nr:hypothetical protein [Chloroflexota bacterium]
MIGDAEARVELLERIRARRVGIAAFAADLGTRASRLTNLSIICSAVVTALTAGPALGGTRFTDMTADVLDLPDQSLVWRGLCFLAMILSIVAAVATNLYKSHDVAARLAKAEASNVALEGLETLVEFGQISTAEAVKLYQQYIAEIPFVHDRPSDAAERRRSSIDARGQHGEGDTRSRA